MTAITYPLVIDVTDAPYLACRDGTADARPGIQAALDAVGQAGGGTVYLPAGYYTVATLPGQGAALSIHYSNVTLKGEGYASHLHATGSAVGDPCAFSVLAIGSDTRILNHIQVTKLYLSTFDSFPTFLCGLGVILTSGSKLLSNLTVDFCWLATSSICGFTNDAPAQNLIFRNNQIVRVGEHGIYMAHSCAGGQLENNFLAGVDPRSRCQVATGIALKNTSDFYVRNNLIQGFRHSAINPADWPNHRVHILNNTIQSMLHTGAGGIVANNLTDSVVEGNTFTDIATTAIECQTVGPTHDISGTSFRHNRFARVGGRMITVESLTPGYHPYDITVEENVGEDCTQGIAFDGVQGENLVRKNQVHRWVTTANFGVNFLNAGVGSTVCSNNVVDGYTGSYVDPAVVSSGNAYNGYIEHTTHPASTTAALIHSFLVLKTSFRKPATETEGTSINLTVDYLNDSPYGSYQKYFDDGRDSFNRLFLEYMTQHPNRAEWQTTAALLLCNTFDQFYQTGAWGCSLWPEHFDAAFLVAVRTATQWNTRFQEDLRTAWQGWWNWVEEQI